MSFPCKYILSALTRQLTRTCRYTYTNLIHVYTAFICVLTYTNATLTENLTATLTEILNSGQAFFHHACLEILKRSNCFRKFFFSITFLLLSSMCFHFPTLTLLTSNVCNINMIRDLLLVLKLDVLVMSLFASFLRTLVVPNRAFSFDVI